MRLFFRPALRIAAGILAAFCAQSPALAQATLAQDSGTALTTVIHDSQTNAANDTQTVYGSTDLLAQSADVQLTGNTNLNLTESGGSAFITDAPNDGTLNWTSLLVDPTTDISELQFTLALEQAGQLNVYYLLATGGGYQLANGSPISQAAGTPVQYLINGDVFTVVVISSSVPIASVTGLATGVRTSGSLPEPTTWAMMLLGFGAIGLAVKRRKTDTRATPAENPRRR